MLVPGQPGKLELFVVKTVKGTQPVAKFGLKFA
jgi:hypothetical protein